MSCAHEDECVFLLKPFNPLACYYPLRPICVSRVCVWVWVFACACVCVCVGKIELGGGGGCMHVWRKVGMYGCGCGCEGLGRE